MFKKKINGFRFWRGFYNMLRHDTGEWEVVRFEIELESPISDPWDIQHHLRQIGIINKEGIVDDMSILIPSKDFWRVSFKINQPE